MLVTDEIRTITDLQENEIMKLKVIEKLYLLAFRMIGDKESAAQLIIELLNDIKSECSEAELFKSAYSILSNKKLKATKNKKSVSFASLEKVIISLQHLSLETDYSENEEKFYISQVTQRCLNGLLQCLSFNQRFVFVMYMLLGVDMRTISAIVGKSEGATRIQEYRARQKLEKFLEENCSLYDKKNNCRCKNLIDFFRKQEWLEELESHDLEEFIQREDIRIKNSIIDIYKVRELYNGLPELILPLDIIKIVTGTE